MYKVNNTLTSAYGDMDLSKKQGPVREHSRFALKYQNLICEKFEETFKITFILKY